LKEAWQALRALYPADFLPDAGEVRRWHADAAAVCQRLRLSDELLRHLGVLIEAAPDREEGWARRGRLYARKRRWEEAAADFTQALSRAPDDASLWLERGVAHGCLGLWKQSADDLCQAVRRRKDDSGIWFRLGLAEARLGRSREALADFTRALKLK